MENSKRRGGMRRRKVCQFCADKDKKIDYKDVETLKKYTTERPVHAQCTRGQLHLLSRELV